MCNQSVGLIASVIEKCGIPTVGLSLLREVTERVEPPRALFVTFRHGYPLGEPNHVDLQHRIIKRALELLVASDPLPILATFRL
jgi:hypothetical protein